MSKNRDPSADTGAPAPATTPETDQLSQAPQPEPISGSFDSAPIGDNSLKDPIIINR